MADRPPFSPLVPPLGEATVSEWIRHSILRGLGVERATFEELERAAWNKRDPDFERLVGRSDERFDALRMARLRMGHLRYGQRGRNHTDAPTSCIRRLEAYAEGGNLEHLIDVFNLCEIEWIWPGREGSRFYEATLVPVEDLSDAQGACRFYRQSLFRGELVAIARWCIDECLAPAHPRAHYSPVDDGMHAEER